MPCNSQTYATPLSQLSTRLRAKQPFLLEYEALPDEQATRYRRNDLGTKGKTRDQVGEISIECESVGLVAAADDIEDDADMAYPVDLHVR